MFTWEVALGDFADVEQEGRGSDQIHDQDSGKKHLPRQDQAQRLFREPDCLIFFTQSPTQRGLKRLYGPGRSRSGNLR